MIEHFQLYYARNQSTRSKMILSSNIEKKHSLYYYPIFDPFYKIVKF